MELCFKSVKRRRKTCNYSVFHNYLYNYFYWYFFFLNGFKLLFLVTCFQIEELPLVFLVREVC